MTEHKRAFIFTIAHDQLEAFETEMVILTAKLGIETEMLQKYDEDNCDVCAKEE